MLASRLLKKHLWAVYAAAIALTAYLNAHAVMLLVGARLGPDAAHLALASPLAGAVTAAAQASLHATSADAILRRNPFDSATGPLDDPPPSDPPAPEDFALTDPWSAPACDGVKVSAIAASSDADWSFAALHVGGDDNALLRRRGDEIVGKTVRFVGWDRVWLTSGAHLCQASMFTEAPASSGAPLPPAEPKSKIPGALDPELRKGISKVSATEFRIDRGVFEQILGSQGQLIAGIHTAPEMRDGKTVGFRLNGIKAGTLGDAIGLTNGDLLQSINGFDLTDPEKLLEAYARLRTADHLTLHLDRKGVGTNLDYAIK
jgi:general secretion pathway protein C